MQITQSDGIFILVETLQYFRINQEVVGGSSSTFWNGLSHSVAFTSHFYGAQRAEKSSSLFYQWDPYDKLVSKAFDNIDIVKPERSHWFVSAFPPEKKNKMRFLCVKATMSHQLHIKLYLIVQLGILQAKHVNHKLEWILIDRYLKLVTDNAN